MRLLKRAKGEELVTKSSVLTPKGSTANVSVLYIPIGSSIKYLTREYNDF